MTDAEIEAAVKAMRAIPTRGVVPAVNRMGMVGHEPYS